MKPVKGWALLVANRLVSLNYEGALPVFPTRAMAQDERRYRVGYLPDSRVVRVCVSEVPAKRKAKG